MKIAFGLWFDFIFYFVLNFLLSFPNYFFLINYSLTRRILKYYAYNFDGMLYLLDLIFKNAYNSDNSEVFHWFWIWLQPICIIYGWFLFSVSNKVLYKFIVFLFVVFFFFWHWSNDICKAVREDFLLTPAVMKGFRLWQCLVIYTTTVEL